MGNAMVKYNQQLELAKAKSHAQIERYRKGRAIAKIQREAAKHMIIERVYAYKAMYGVNLITELELHAATCADQFIQAITEKLNQGGRSQEQQQFLYEMCEYLKTNFTGAVLGIINVGNENIAEIASRGIDFGNGRW